MKRFLFGLVAFVLLGSPAKADDPTALVEKAVKAMGGQEKLAGHHAAHVKAKGTFHMDGEAHPITTEVTAQGLDHHRVEWEGEFDGKMVKGFTLVSGIKGWRKIDDETMELDDDALKGEKQDIYLQLVAANPTLLHHKGFKITKSEKDAVTAMGPDGKEFTLHFDKATGLPSKVVATVRGFTGEAAKQETTYSDYKDFGGIKKATKIVTKRDGEPYLAQELTEYKALDKVDPKTFEEPK